MHYDHLVQYQTSVSNVCLSGKFALKTLKFSITFALIRS